MANKKRSQTKPKNLSNLILTALVIILAIALVLSLFYGDTLREMLGLSTSNPEQPGKTDSSLGYQSTLNLPVELSGEGMIEIHFIDVGQGDGILLRLPGGVDVLIDSGSGTSASTATVNKHIAYLQSLDLGVIEYMIATHPDSDHINMLDDVLDHFEVANIYTNGLQKDTATFTAFWEKANSETVNGVKANFVAFDGDGDVYHLGTDDYTLDIYAPGYERFADVNSMSPIVHLSYCGFDALFVGDAHTDTEDWFLDTYTAIDCDVLKVGHHGSSTSSGDAFLAAVAPEYAVISVGEKNSYQHPYYMTMNTLFNLGIVTYRTNRHGNIVLHVDNQGEFAFEVQNIVPVENNKNLINDRMMVPAA